MIDLPDSAAVPSSTDSLGCRTGKLHQSQEIASDGMIFYRRGTTDARISQVTTPASGRGHLVGISLGGSHRRRIFHPHHSSLHEFGVGAGYVRSFAEDYRADLQGGFDFLLMEFSTASFDRALDEGCGSRGPHRLECVTAVQDPVLFHLGAALLPALLRPAEASPLFIEQMGAVIQTHLLERYGGQVGARTQHAPGLSRLLERRAKNMLLSRLDGGISIAEVATACSLSRSHFIKAFRETTGHTPHQWLQSQRVRRACELLSHSAMPLAEVATLCGFADQSHFTRVFTRWKQATPGRWRKEASL